MFKIIKKPSRKTFLILAMPIAAFLSAAVVQAQEDLTDNEISNAVDDQLAIDLLLPVWNIDVATKEGIVTLTGTVHSILEKERAEKIAATVKGVRGIINTLTIASLARSDAEIKRGVENALVQNPATESWETKVSVKDGIVTLTGKVDSWQEKQLAGKVAKGVRGVTEVKNDTLVVYQEQRSDSEILQDIQGILRWDAYVDDALIDVTVDEGKVTLNGVVGSLAEKAEAGSDAWVTGVDGVENNLKIEWWDRDERLRTGKYISLTDAEIEAAVADAFSHDPRVVADNISIEANTGYVTLRGTVNSLKALRVAEQDARGVVGVWSVDNKIKVRTKTLGDTEVENNITSALREDPNVDRYEIRVTVRNGVAYLFGEVDSVFEKNRADDIAARQAGVVLVKNHLSINEPFIDIYNPYVDDLYSYEYEDNGYKGGTITTVKSNWEIQEDIKDELFWSPFVDADEVSVEVDNGKVTLTGTVDTWGERRAATKNAFEGGAVIVDNDLKVKFGPDLYLP